MKRIINILALLGCIISLNSCKLFNSDLIPHKRVYFSYLNDSEHDVKIKIIGENEVFTCQCGPHGLNTVIVINDTPSDSELFTQYESLWHCAMSSYLGGIVRCELYLLGENTPYYVFTPDDNIPYSFFRSVNWVLKDGVYGNDGNDRFITWEDYTYTIPMPPTAE